MEKLKSILTSRYILWLILAIPGLGLLKQFASGNAKYGMLMHISGEFAGRFLAITLIATPLAMLFPKARFAAWLVRNRRFFGVAAFAYTLVHTVFYLMQETFAKIVDEFFHVGMITGWVAFFIFVPLAATSTDIAVRRMGENWKKLQRWVYLAGIMAFFHWALVDVEHAHWKPAFFHFTPFFVLSAYRIWVVYFKEKG